VKEDCQQKSHAAELSISLLVGNLHGSGRHYLCIEIHARAFVLQVPSVPSKRDWLALQDCDDKECDNVGDVQADRGKCQPSERHFREDAQVCTDDRDLDQGQSDDVENLIDVVDL
jgi:hypothetical protein